MAEIFVYSPRMEGIHLRGGKVARGGIRWSDRREDFRTEILGLMKAQMVKNAVIVPVGAKGGFVLKHPPPASDREAFAKEGIACYQVLIKGLLDITDNLGPGGVIIHPEQVRRLDGDDPYLVVAADKGTATFSDIANEISLDYGFWLGDAFASGGSQGYDHKKMGITARGAWVAVKRHFRELGRDIGQEPFSVVGIGDMAGDVFGNGMLREKTIKLVGAFNHAHIFIDPHPDPAKSFAERERLFNLPRSQWSDYDASLISQGGGIWSRQAKSIPLSPEARALLGIEAESSPPEMLIKALLKAPVDLLWFGGIGNYVKAATESQAEANDRTNDSLRIDAKDLCAKVIGEGANMAVTQRGRVEFGLNGGRLNTDAIDNSAGVDASDHEVNIKILVNAVVADGDMTMKQRNSLLVEMTEEVGQLVLRDNFMQTQALSLIAADGVDGLDNQERLMRFLEKAGRLDRAIEFLPDGEQVAERLAARRGLTRPEIAVLLAYVKIWLFDEIQAGSLADDPALADELVRYFPTALQQNWRAAMDRHRLKREIVSTHIVNSLVNRMGLVFVHQLAEKTGQTPEAIARAWLTARAIFDLRSLWAEIEAAEPSMSSAALYAILGEINRMLERGTAWFLRNRSHPYSVVEVTAELAPGIVELEGSLEEALPAQRRGILEDQANRFVALGAPLELSRKVGRLVALASGPDIVTIARAREVGVTQAAKVYYAAGVRLSLGWMRFLVENLPVSTHWQKLASSALLDELYGLQRELAIKSLEAGLSLEDWLAGRGRGLERLEQLTAELRAAPHPDLAMLTVAARQIRGLLEG
jgi:glutamate dehydrogenase